MFNIIGMPRTRTAWLSNLFTCNGVVCLHDWYALNSEPAKGEQYAYSDSLYHSNYDPKKTLFIHRPADEVMASLKKAFIFPDGMDFEQLEEALFSQKAYMEQAEGMHVNHTDLEDDRNIGVIWRYLTGTEPDMQRIKQMQNLKIVVNYTNILDAFKQNEVA